MKATTEDLKFTKERLENKIGLSKREKVLLKKINRVLETV